MTNEFINYYGKVQEDVNDLLEGIYSDLIDEMKESSYGFSFFSWYNRNESYFSEYNNGIYITLREAVEIIEQTARQINDSSLYINAGDCKQQIQSMAYYTYKNDLNAEFILAVKERLNNDLAEFENDMDIIQKQMDELQELIDKKEEKLEELEEQKYDDIEEDMPNLLEAIDKKIEKHKQEKEQLEEQMTKLEEDYEEPSNLFENANKMIGEL